MSERRMFKALIVRDAEGQMVVGSPGESACPTAMCELIFAPDRSPDDQIRVFGATLFLNADGRSVKRVQYPRPEEPLTPLVWTWEHMEDIHQEVVAAIDRALVDPSMVYVSPKDAAK